MPKTPPNQTVTTPENRVYANAATANAGPFDLTLDFGYRAGNERPEGQVRVTMSYEHAASLLTMLQRLVGQYTESYGALPNPEIQIEAAPVESA